MTFGEKLYALRSAAGLSQKALAVAAGVGQPTIGHWETGERDPSWLNVMKLCGALAVTCEAFADCVPGGAADRRGPGRPAGSGLPGGTAEAGEPATSKRKGGKSKT